MYISQFVVNLILLAVLATQISHVSSSPSLTEEIFPDVYVHPLFKEVPKSPNKLKKAMHKSFEQISLTEKVTSFDKLQFSRYGVNAAALPAKLKGDKQCHLVVEMAVVHDSTQSYTDDAQVFIEKLPTLMTMLTDAYPGSRFSLSLFRDKPLIPLGYGNEAWHDECFAVLNALGEPVDKITETASRMYTAGGYDHQEAQLEGLLRGALAPAVNWTAPDVTIDPATGYPIVRLLILTTDATWHSEGDGKAAAEFMLKTMAPNTLHEDPSPLKDDTNAKCLEFDYPAYESVTAALKEKRIIPAFLVQPSFYIDTTTGEQKLFPEFNDAFKITGNKDFLDPHKGMSLFYEGLMKKLDLHGFVAPLDADAGNLLTIMKDVLDVLPEIMCGDEETTSTSTASTPRQTETEPLTAEDLTTLRPETTTTVTTATENTITTVTQSTPVTGTVPTTQTMPVTGPVPTTQTMPVTQTVPTTQTTQTNGTTKGCDCECENSQCACCGQIEVAIHIDINTA